jgi:hypothetical protein
MPLTQLTTTIRAPFNQGVPGIYAALLTWINAQTDIVITDVDWFRPLSTYDASESRIRISYQQATAPAIGGTWVARLYQDTPGGLTAQEAFNLEFSSGFQAVPFFQLDVTEHSRARTGPNSLLVICMSTGGTNLNLVGHDRAAFIAEPAGDIAAGATGTAILYDASARVLSTTITIRNVGAVQWDAGQRNIVVIDELSGEYIGLPSCCGAAALVTAGGTTTTPYPCPGYLSGQTNPVFT